MPAPIAVGKGKFAIVDDKHWAEVQAMGSWCLRDENQYPIVNYKGKTTSLASVIYAHIDPTYKGEVDHIDLNPLNNLEENLRPATRTQQMHNQRLKINNQSGVKGVYWREDRQKWHVQIRINGIRTHLGLFDSLEEAKKVRLKAAKFHFGEYAREE